MIENVEGLLEGSINNGSLEVNCDLTNKNNFLDNLKVDFSSEFYDIIADDSNVDTEEVTSALKRFEYLENQNDIKFFPSDEGDCIKISDSVSDHEFNNDLTYDIIGDQEENIVFIVKSEVFKKMDSIKQDSESYMLTNKDIVGYSSLYLDESIKYDTDYVLKFDKLASIGDNNSVVLSEESIVVENECNSKKIFNSGLKIDKRIESDLDELYDVDSDKNLTGVSVNGVFNSVDIVQVNGVATLDNLVLGVESKNYSYFRKVDKLQDIDSSIGERYSSYGRKIKDKKNYS